MSNTVICPPGTKAAGGTCECEKAKVWNEGTWNAPTCSEGLCKISQPYDKCKGKQNGHQLGDDTWCWNERRHARCPVASGLPYLHICRFQ